MKGRIQFLLPSPLKSYLSSILVLLQCGESAFTENTFSSQQLKTFLNVSGNCTVKCSKPKRWLSWLSCVHFFLPQNECYANHVCIQQEEKQPVLVMAESAVSVICLRIARAQFLNCKKGRKICTNLKYPYAMNTYMCEC